MPAFTKSLQARSVERSCFSFHKLLGSRGRSGGGSRSNFRGLHFFVRLGNNGSCAGGAASVHGAGRASIAAAVVLGLAARSGAAAGVATGIAARHLARSGGSLSAAGRNLATAIATALGLRTALLGVCVRCGERQGGSHCTQHYEIPHLQLS